MPYFPTLPAAARRCETVDVFGGYDHNLKIDDGEFYDMTNLTGEFYPLVGTRRRRGTLSQLESPAGLLAKDKLCIVDGSRLFYGDDELTDSLTAAGVAISTQSAMLPKKLVSMGAYICIFPDKLYINTADLSDCGSMDAFFSADADAAITYTLCRADGQSYESPTLSASEPAAPANGQLWIDSSDSEHVLKQYSSASAAWSAVTEVYVKIACAGIGEGFSVYDGVTVSGCEAAASASETLAAQALALNGSKIIYAVDSDFIVVTGLLDAGFSQTGGVAVERKAPELDFVTEAGNRLWGCCYVSQSGLVCNEIYACALGDFRNWNQFMGIATDSYAAAVGSDGAFTGAATHLGYPVFFKENCLHKVYISATGAHRIAESACRGVQKGSHNSLCTVNETLYYKSRDAFCAYDGSLPVSVSAAWGGERYSQAAAGAIGERCYVSMKDAKECWHMFVFDCARGFWHREDSVHAAGFARVDDELYYIDADTKKLTAVLGSVGTPEGEPQWEAVTGLYGADAATHSYVRSVKVRLTLAKGSRADLYIQYDSEGEWLFAGHMEGSGTGSFMLPVRPRRCDHFRFKLKGTGQMRIYSITKVLEEGSQP